MFRTDRTWKGGCETINMTGKRVGKLCNGNFYRTKTINGRTIRCCYNHLDGCFQDVENDSFCEEGADDEINESDYSFIAPEDDGTFVVNGKVFGNVENSEYFNSAFNDAETEVNAETESESEYEPETTETETETDDEMEFEAQDVYTEAEVEGDAECGVFEAETEVEDEYYMKYIKEKEKSKNLEVLLSQERQKLDEYKKIFEKNMNDDLEGFTQVVEDADAHNAETFGKEESELDVVKSKLEKLENTVHDLSKFIRDIFSSAEKYSL